MYRVLAVDDEPIIADGLYDELLLDESLDLDVYKAYSAKGALELLSKHRIDIVVTDIRMPGMDGMALLERIRDSWPECKVIFLTGHREFDYVYKAIQHRGLQYVLKTEGYGKVLAAVRNATDEIDRESTLNGRLDDMRRRVDTASMYLQKEFFAQLTGIGRAVCPTSQDLAECGIGLTAEGMVFLVAGRMDHPPQKLEFAGQIKAMQAVKLVAEQFLSPLMLVACIPDEESDVILLAQPKKLPECGHGEEWDAAWHSAELFLRETLELMQGSIRSVLGCKISFGMRSLPVGWDGIAQAYDSVKRMLGYRIGVGEEMLLTEANAGHMARAQWPKPRAEALAALLDRGEQEEYLKEFDSLAAAFCNGSGMDAAACDAYGSIALVLLAYLNRWHLQNKAALIPEPGLLLKADRFSNCVQAFCYLREVSAGLFQHQQSEQEKRAANILKRLTAYIDGHLAEDLSLLKLSEHMYFNPSYLSRLIKQLSGKNLTDYIQDKRIEKSKELLGKRENKIADIAAAVGFGSATNFTRFFKRAAGITPQEYRGLLSERKAGNQM